jgi:hypothetical protein
LAPQTQADVLAALQHAGSNGLQPADVHRLVQQHPDAAAFFAKTGPYHDFSHHLLAHASGQGFLMGAVIGGVAVLAAVLLINVRKSEVPSDPAAMAAA